MEEYVAEGARPIDRCLADVNAADLYVGVFAWRYGYVPSATASADGTSAHPGNALQSITEAELRCALPKRPMIFLLDPNASWPARWIDAITGENEGGTRVKRLRDELSQAWLAGYFTTPEDLARQVSAAVHRREMSDRLGTMELTIQTGLEDALMAGGPISDSTLYSMKMSLSAASIRAALRLDLRDGKYWWSTRLFFLACVTPDLTNTRLFIFVEEGDQFAGAATPASLRNCLARTDHLFREFDDECKQSPLDRFDLAGALDARAATWERINHGTEEQRRIFVSKSTLKDWLGSDFIERGVAQGNQEYSPRVLRAIMDWPHPFVPVTHEGKLVSVIDRSALSEQLARLFIEDMATHHH